MQDEMLLVQFFLLLWMNWIVIYGSDGWYSHLIFLFRFFSLLVAFVHNLELAELNLKLVWECFVTMSAVLFMEVMGVLCQTKGAELTTIASPMVTYCLQLQGTLLGLDRWFQFSRPASFTPPWHDPGQGERHVRQADCDPLPYTGSPQAYIVTQKACSHQRHLKHIYLHKKNGMFPWIMIQFQVNNNKPNYHLYFLSKETYLSTNS
jgi:hypothetical protein